MQRKNKKNKKKKRKNKDNEENEIIKNRKKQDNKYKINASNDLAMWPIEQKRYEKMLNIF